MLYKVRVEDSLEQFALLFVLYNVYFQLKIRLKI